MEKLIGRKEEQAILNEAFISEEPELVALFGRRRVGKTFLIREYFKDSLIFEFSGEREAKLAVQLYNFAGALSEASGSDDMWLRSLLDDKKHCS